jgi:RHS repeat-associated protein
LYGLLTSISGKHGSTVKVQAAYAYDTLGRRTSKVDSGEIYSRYQSSAISTVYTYNDRSELTGAKSYYGSNPADTTYPVAARGFSYSFDHIGNRTQSTVTGLDGSDVYTTGYTANNLNQVATRSLPAATAVTGLAPASAAVTVNGQTATRQGQYFYKNVAAGSALPLWQSIAASSNLGGSTSRNVWHPVAPHSFTYDFDGNLTQDDRWVYTWDAENRMTSMETVAAAYGAGVPRQRLTFVYDYLGRRVRKTVANWNGSAYVTAVDRKFIYDGWNLIAEHNALASGEPAVARYAWGIDLSGTLQGGGGVGGLLAVFDVTGSATHLPHYDGNGNLLALTDAATGALTATYEYDAFGNPQRSTGTYAATNPFRFSTKYTDTETSLVYYGRRFYDPKLGRFVGRDPIEEQGGLNLYGFVANNAVNRWDLLGLVDYERERNQGINFHPGEDWELEWWLEQNRQGWSFLEADRMYEIYQRRELDRRIAEESDNSAPAGPEAPDATNNADPISAMADRLGGYIDGMPKDDLRLRFLHTQQDILRGLAGADWSPDSRKWLNAVVRDFMNPLFDALDGNGNERWKDTFSSIAKMQGTSSSIYGPNPAEAGAGIGLATWANDLLASREMALTHITQDLRLSIIRNGVGSDADWASVGRIVSVSERANFMWLERSGSSVLGVFNSTFNVAKLRDEMREKVKADYP